MMNYGNYIYAYHYRKPRDPFKILVIVIAVTLIIAAFFEKLKDFIFNFFL